VFSMNHLVLRQINIKCSRDERWSGHWLDWIRTISNFVEFGLDPDFKSLPNLGCGPDLDWVNGKEMRHFCCEKTGYFQYFKLHFYIWKIFWTVVGLDWVFKNEDWTGSGSQNMTVRSSLKCSSISCGKNHLFLSATPVWLTSEKSVMYL